jgi:hypothetical protein
MSKEAIYAVELERVSNNILKKALNLLIKELNPEIIKTSNFKIYNNKTIPVNGVCIKLKDLAFPIDIYVDEKGKLVINGDEMDVKKAAGRIKQFYEGMEFSIRYRSPLKYNKRKDELELLMEARL